MDFGTVTAITVTNPGSGYLTAGGIKKFVDTLPGLCGRPSTRQSYGPMDCVSNNLGQHIPLAVPDTTTFPAIPGSATPAADYYEIALVAVPQVHELFPARLRRTQLPGRDPAARVCAAPDPGQRVSEQGVPLAEPDRHDPNPDAATALQAVAVDDPQFLGPVIAAEKDRPVRITFYNLLPTGQGGDLIIPADSTLMGAGFVPSSWRELMDLGTVMDEVRNPPCTQSSPSPKPDTCFKDNRATLHLHGGLSPWISDGTPHQWITPAGEALAYRSTPPAAGCERGQRPRHAERHTGLPACRLLGARRRLPDLLLHQPAVRAADVLSRPRLRHDAAECVPGRGRGLPDLGRHREAADYPDADNQTIIPADQIPLIIQDRTFVPNVTQLSQQDPDLGLQPLGRPWRLLVPPRLHAGPEPGRPLGHERLRPLDVRSLVLAAGRHRGARSDRQPVLRPDTATWTFRPPGPIRPTRSASRR